MTGRRLRPSQSGHGLQNRRLSPRWFEPNTWHLRKRPMAWGFPGLAGCCFGPMRSRCVHGSPAVSSCARTYSGRPDQRAADPLVPGCAGYRGPFGGCACPLEDHRWLSFWPTHSPQNPSAGAASPCGTGISRRNGRVVVAPRSPAVISASPDCAACRPGPRCSGPGRAPLGASACRRAGYTLCVDLRWTCPRPGGGPGMYLAIWHRCQ